MTALVYAAILIASIIIPLVLCWFDPAGFDPEHDFHHLFTRK